MNLWIKRKQENKKNVFSKKLLFQQVKAKFKVLKVCRTRGAAECPQILFAEKTKFFVEILFAKPEKLSIAWLLFAEDKNLKVRNMFCCKLPFLS